MLCEFVMQIKENLPIFINQHNNICSDNKGFLLVFCNQFVQAMSTKHVCLIYYNRLRTWHQSSDRWCQWSTWSCRTAKTAERIPTVTGEVFSWFLFYKKVSFWFIIVYTPCNIMILTGVKSWLSGMH